MFTIVDIRTINTIFVRWHSSVSFVELRSESTFCPCTFYSFAHTHVVSPNSDVVQYFINFCLASRQVSDLGQKRTQYLTFAPSAPGELSPPLPGNAHGTISDIRRDIRAIVSQLEKNATSAQNMVVGGQEVNDSRNLLVSGAHTLVATECPLIIAQTQTRSAI